MSQKLLEGVVDNRDEIILELKEKNEELERRNGELVRLSRDLETANAVLRAGNAKSIASLRRLLQPFHQALKQVFGEMEAMGDAPASDTVVTPSGNSQLQKWEAVKLQMAPRLAQAIQLLMLQGHARRTHMASALRMDYSNCNKNVIGVLLRQGWIVEEGGELSLKQL